MLRLIAICDLVLSSDVVTLSLAATNVEHRQPEINRNLI